MLKAQKIRGIGFLLQSKMGKLAEGARLPSNLLSFATHWFNSMSPRFDAATGPNALTSNWLTQACYRNQARHLLHHETCELQP